MTSSSRTSEAAEMETASPGTTGLDPKRWAILAVVVIAQLIVVLDASIVTLALPSAQRALHISVANRAMGDHRLHLGLRWTAAVGRSHRRLRWPPAHVHHRFDRLRRRVRPGWPGHGPGACSLAPAPSRARSRP